MPINLQKFLEFKNQNIDFALRNITQIREFHQHLAMISAVALGGLITGYAQDVVGIPILALGGGILLICVMILSTIYLTRILTGENNKLAEMRKILFDAKGERVDKVALIKKWIDVQSRPTLGEGEKDDYLEWTSICFVLGIIASAFSFA